MERKKRECKRDGEERQRQLELKINRLKRLKQMDSCIAGVVFFFVCEIF